ncbi:SMP-30/gluconolactonase/LRE family protein [Nocardioidaceae bacterium SCSIO 66511]|nr:SMP-30/gluconolactonase/LRE family protein [Nocardioidaceae bacterium SCSIO 66511]
MTSAHAVTAVPAWLGESPVWDASTQTLLWVDILRGELHRYDPTSGDEVLRTLDIPIGAVALRRGGGYVVAAGTGFWLLDGDQVTHLVDVDDRGERMNDGKCDPAGRFLAGTMTSDRQPGAGLYRLDADGGVHRLLECVRLSNGLGWNPSGTTMYYIDTPTRRIDVLAYDPTSGAVGNRRAFVKLTGVQGNPDGLTVDDEGGVWVAMAGGSCVRRFTPDGRADRVVEVPATKVTSCTFGGPDLRDLYITTSTDGLTVDELRTQPEAGLLFRARPGVTGLPASAYAG